MKIPKYQRIYQDLMKARMAEKRNKKFEEIRENERVENEGQ